MQGFSYGSESRHRHDAWGAQVLVSPRPRGTESPRVINCVPRAENKVVDPFGGVTVVWWIVGITIVLVLGYVVWTYNQLVSLSKRADAAWSDIDVQLKRRWDLVPALVETVKGYAQHESG